MTVTEVEQGKKNDRRYNIYLDGEFSFAVYDDTILEYHLKKGMIISLAEISEITEFDRKKRAHEKAVELLSYHDFSKNGLIRRLVEKGIPADDALFAADELEAAGYIDDQKFAADLAKYYCEVKGFGKKRIIFELISKGIEKETAEEASNICEEYEENIDTELKKALRNKDISDQKEKRKVFDKLARKGYDYDSIKEAMQKLINGEENY